MFLLAASNSDAVTECGIVLQWCAHVVRHWHKWLHAMWDRLAQPAKLHGMSVQSVAVELNIHGRCGTYDWVAAVEALQSCYL